MTITAHRYHDISCGHRVVGHENKCRYLHGHNYRVHFHCQADYLDNVGRVIDFGVIKSFLCEWLETWWDHKMLLWEEDPLLFMFDTYTNSHQPQELRMVVGSSIVEVPFNPTAENMAKHLLEVIGPDLLPTNVKLVKVVVEETRKCAATAEL